MRVLLCFFIRYKGFRSFSGGVGSAADGFSFVEVSEDRGHSLEEAVCGRADEKAGRGRFLIRGGRPLSP